MKHLMILLGILVFFGCAVDENQFDDNFANDQFQWLETDGITEDHITDGAEMDQVDGSSGQGHRPDPPQRRVVQYVMLTCSLEYLQLPAIANLRIPLGE